MKDDWHRVAAEMCVDGSAALAARSRRSAHPNVGSSAGLQRRLKEKDAWWYWGGRVAGGRGGATGALACPAQYSIAFLGRWASPRLPLPLAPRGRCEGSPSSLLSRPRLPFSTPVVSVATEWVEIERTHRVHPPRFGILDWGGTGSLSSPSHPRFQKRSRPSLWHHQCA